VNVLLPWSGVLIVYVINKWLPASFNTLFLVNIWFFSLPHTFSTFTRSDRRHFKVVMPVILMFTIFLGAVIYASNAVGIVVVYSFYFYWQQFHYGKQNLGVARWQGALPASWVDQLFYILIVGLSLSGLLGMEKQGFFGYVLYFPFTLHLSKWFIFLVMMVITGCYCLYRPKQRLHALGHTSIFSLAYLLTEHFALGWLLLNVFHNIQYLSFMKKFEKTLSFFLLPVLMTGVLFFLQFYALESYMIWLIPLNVALMLALNFTHYTVDGIIWKSKKIMTE
jgi:hypothetical protein